MILKNLPKEWKIVKLEEVLTLIRNGLTYQQNKAGNGLPITRIETISDEKIDPTKVGFVNNPTDDELKEYRLIVGDILFSHINSLGHIGKTAIYEGTPKILLHGMNLLLLRPDKQKVEPYFLLYLLKIYRAKKIFKNMAKKAVNQASINQTQLIKVKIPLPLLPEQKKIAEILSTVDKAIQKVDEIIAKTERLKKGLMQKLLTKGIGHKEFKYSKELGCEIPKEWEVVRLKDICIINPEQIDPRIQMPNRTFLYIDIRSVEEGRIKEYKEILGKNAPVRARRVIHKNDVIMSTVRPYLKAFALVPEQYDGQICSTGFAILKCNQNKINPHYLLYTLLFDKSIDQCKAMMVGGQYPALNQSQVENLKIPLPPLQEQQKIAEILSTIDKKLELERKRKEKFDKIKKGLMNDLLTGRKRVKLK